MVGRFTPRPVVRSLVLAVVRTVVLTAVLTTVLTACGSKPEETPAVEPAATSVQGGVSSAPVQAAIPQEPAGTLASMGVLAPVEENAAQLEEPTPIPESAEAPEAAATSEQSGTAEPTDILTSSEAITMVLTTTVALPTRVPTRVPVVVAQPTQTPAQVVSTSALAILDDETPAPPLTVIVSMNREYEGYRFRISGLVRNDDTQPYTGLQMNATFFRDDGSRFGPIKVNVQCPILEPGESCPFMLEAIDKNITQVMLHPDGKPTERLTVQVELQNVSSYQDSIGYVHITGSVANPNPVAVRDVTVTGVLVDERGEIVSTGVALLVQTIEAGASAPFDVLIRGASYSQYQLYVQALPL